MERRSRRCAVGQHEVKPWHHDGELLVGHRCERRDHRFHPETKQGGCGMCGGQGYKGRTAVVEILFFDEELNELLARGESKAELKALAVKKGFKSMKDDGILKVLEGITDLEALSKVVNLDK